MVLGTGQFHNYIAMAYVAMAYIVMADGAGYWVMTPPATTVMSDGMLPTRTPSIPVGDG